MGFFDFFKKKKKSNGQNQTSGQTVSTSSQQNTNYQQVQQIQNKQENLSQSNTLQQSNVVQNNQPVVEDNEQWLYDYILQYLTSPLWKIPISQFIDENCLVFDEAETNHFSYTDVHNNFKKLVDNLLEELLADLSINNELFLKQLEKGLQNENDKKVFEQLLIVDNFLVLKRHMLKRNKELELEAMSALEQDTMNELNFIDQANNSNNLQTLQTEQNVFVEDELDKENEILRLKLEAEQAEIEHAIAMSLAIEQEKSKIVDQEDYELQEAIRQSQLEYSKQEEEFKRLKEEEEQVIEQLKKQLLIEQEQQKQQEEELKRQEQLLIKQQQEKQKQLQEQQKQFEAQSEFKKKEEQKIQEQLQQKKEEIILKQQQIIEQKVDSQKEQIQQNKADQLANLPPITKNKHLSPLSMEELINERANLVKMLDQMKETEKKKIDAEKQKDNQEQEEELKRQREEALFERKKRLLAQREMILQKKKEQREVELKQYKEKVVAGTQKLDTRQSILIKDIPVEKDQNVFGFGAFSSQANQVNSQNLENKKKLMNKIRQNLEDD